MCPCRCPARLNVRAIPQFHICPLVLLANYSTNGIQPIEQSYITGSTANHSCAVFGTRKESSTDQSTYVSGLTSVQHISEGEGGPSSERRHGMLVLLRSVPYGEGRLPWRQLTMHSRTTLIFPFSCVFTSVHSPACTTPKDPSKNLFGKKLAVIAV